MRWLRLLYAIVSASFRSKISPTDQSRISFRVWLTDVDAAVMNHATMLTVMEMGRIDFMMRSGFFRLARQRKWYFPSRSISAHFLRPLKVLQKAELITRVLHIGQRWIYTEQKIVRQNKDIATCVVKSTVKKGRETVPADTIATELGFDALPAGGEEIIETLEAAEHLISERLLRHSSVQLENSNQA